MDLRGNSEVHLNMEQLSLRISEDKDSLWYHRYKKYRDEINHLIRRSKRNYYRKYFEKFRLNSKKTWTRITEIINKTRNVSSRINLKIIKWRNGDRSKASGK